MTASAGTMFRTWGMRSALGNVFNASNPVVTIDIRSDGAIANLVLLPGNGLCAELYEPLGQLLAARGISVRLVTLPGYDGSEALDRLGCAPLIEALVPVVREGLGGRGILVGHSLGGLLALCVAARLANEVQKLVLLEPAILPWPWLASVAARFYRRRVVDAERGTFRNRGAGYWRLHDPGSYPARAYAIVDRCGATSDRATEQALVGTTPALYPLPFEKVRVPTLLVRGASSGVSQAAGQWMLSHRLADSRSVVIPNAGHWMVNEQDRLLADTIVAFAMSP